MAEVIVIQTGSTLVSPAVPNRNTRKNPLAFTGLFQRRSNRIEVPVKCFLVRAGGHLTLVDAGWSAQDATHPLRHMGFGLWFASEPVMEEDEAVDRQMARMGISVADLDAVVMTHLDCDHVSGIDGVADAKRILVSREELLRADTADPRYRKKFWRGVEFEHLEMRADPLAPFGASCDVYGDGSLVAYIVPGHSAGSVAYIAREGSHFAILAGDTGYDRASWEKLNLPGPVYNKENMERALLWVHDLLEDPHCIGAFAAHDPAVPPGAYTFGSERGSDL